MKIGILIENKDLFSSGAVQQSLFIYEILQSSNFDVTFYCNDKDYIYFGQPYMNNIKVTNISVETIKNINLLIFLSAVLNEKDSLVLKNMNIKVVQILCGNNYMFNQERLIFGCHKNLHSFNNSYIDEYWLLPMYSHAKSYIETHSKKPVKIMPYIWNTTFVDLWIKDNDDISYKICPDLNVLICEPNVNVFKTSLVPLMISEKCNDIISKIFCLCLKDKEENFDTIFKNYLKIIKNNKLEMYERLKLFKALSILKSQNKCPFIISHQMLNDLNFLHLELFYLGYPVVHNCERMKSCGYFYKDHNIDDGSEALYEAFNNHINKYNTVEYKKNVKELLFNFSPYNKDNKKEYLSSILSLLGKTKIPLKIKEEIPKYVHVHINDKDRYSQCLSVNTNYKIICYNETQINSFFLKEYSQIHLDIYNFIKDYDIKIEFFSLCIIYRFGGLYINPKFKFLETLDSFLELDDDVLLLLEDMSPNLSFMMSRKNVRSMYLIITKYIYLYKSNMIYSRDSWSISKNFNLNCSINLKYPFITTNNIKYKFLVKKIDGSYVYKEKIILELKSEIESKKKVIPKIIWSYWDQPNIPDLINHITNTWRRYCKKQEGWKVQILNKNNIDRFLNRDIDYPSNIWNHIPQHQSDMFGTALVCKYGGIWIDANIIMTNSIDFILEKEWFSYYDKDNNNPEIFLYASVKHSYSIITIHKHLYNIFDINNSNIYTTLKDKYNIDNKYLFPQLIISHLIKNDNKIKDTIINNSINQWDSIYSVISYIKNKIKLKSDILKLLNNDTKKIPYEIKKQPLHKLQGASFNTDISINKDSWLGKLISFQSTKLVLFYSDYENSMLKDSYNMMKNKYKNSFDEIVLYTPEILKKLGYGEYVKKYKSYSLLSCSNKNFQNTGFGAWKPLIIYLEMKKSSKNDIIFYHDINCIKYPIYLQMKNIKNTINILLYESQFDFFISLDYPCISPSLAMYCKTNVIKDFGNEDCYDKRSFCANCIILKNTDISLEFINEWKEACKVDKWINCDQYGELDKRFRWHCPEQGIMSNILFSWIKNKKHNINENYPIISYKDRRFNNIITV